MELLYDPAVQILGLYPQKIQLEKIPRASCSKQHYLQ